MKSRCRGLELLSSWSDALKVDTASDIFGCSVVWLSLCTVVHRCASLCAVDFAPLDSLELVLDGCGELSIQFCDYVSSVMRGQFKPNTGVFVDDGGVVIELFRQPGYFIQK